MRVPFWTGIPCFRGWQTGQSFRSHSCQWRIICLDEEQWSTGHDLPDWHDIIWMSTSFIVRQCGKGHWNIKKDNHFTFLFCLLIRDPSFLITIRTQFWSHKNILFCSCCEYFLPFHQSLYFYLPVKFSKDLYIGFKDVLLWWEVW